MPCLPVCQILLLAREKRKSTSNPKENSAKNQGEAKQEHDRIQKVQQGTARAKRLINYILHYVYIYS